MIHEAYMPVYIQIFSVDGTGRTEVVQEALADLKIPSEIDVALRYKLLTLLTLLTWLTLFILFILCKLLYTA